MTKARVGNLDILRLLAAIAVMAFHYGYKLHTDVAIRGAMFPECEPVAIWLAAGLLVFFVISGYVIALSVDNQTPLDFAVNRFARLWPAFVVCSAVTALVLSMWPISVAPQPTLVQWLAHLVIVSRVFGQPFLDGVYWTIALEIVFYGWVFVLVATKLFWTRWQLVVTLWLLASAINEYVLESGILRIALITEYSGYFAFGVVLCKLERENSWKGWMLLIASGIWATAATILGESGFFKLYGVTRNASGVALIAPVCLSLFWAFWATPAIFPQRLAIQLGALTYPLYLLHQRIGYAVFEYFGTPENRAWCALVVVGALLAVSWGVAIGIEAPARAAIRKWWGRLSGGPCARGWIWATERQEKK